jgi:hypothetical protein
MEEAGRLNPAAPAGADVDTESLPRCEHALEVLLTHRALPRLSGFWLVIPGACSAVVCAPRSSCAPTSPLQRSFEWPARVVSQGSVAVLACA